MKKRKKLIIVLCIVIPTIIQASLIAFFVFNEPPFEIYSDYVVNGVQSYEIKGKISKIDDDLYSKEYISEQSNLLLNENYLFFLPNETSCNSSELFVFAQKRTSFNDDGKDHSLVHELYVSFLFDDYINYQAARTSLLNMRYGIGAYPQLTNNLFNYQALVFFYNYQSRFTYTIFDDSKLAIVFVSFEAINYKSNIVFDMKYFPSKNIKNSDFPKEKIGFGKSFNCYN